MKFESNFEEATYFYDRGEWSEKRLQALVTKGFITQAEYNEIVGE